MTIAQNPFGVPGNNDGPVMLTCQLQILRNMQRVGINTKFPFTAQSAVKLPGPSRKSGSSLDLLELFLDLLEIWEASWTFWEAS